MKKPLKNKFWGFNLSETILVTGIIGVVAAITIPILTKNFEETIYMSRLKLGYSELTSAMKMAEKDFGNPKYWNFRLTDDRTTNSKAAFEKYFKKYLKIAEICPQGSNSECGMPVSYAGYNCLLANGLGVSFVTDDPEVGKSFYVLIDVNGPKKPNRIGHDVWYFSRYEDGRLMPFGWHEGINKEDILEGYTYYLWYGQAFTLQCVKNRPDNPEFRHACTSYVFLNNWKLPPGYQW